MKRVTVLSALLLFACLSSATTITYTASLSGPNESPPNASPGTGFAVVVYDPVAHTLNVSISFSGLLGTTTASHIHCCTAAPFTGTAGIATQLPSFTGFPSGVTSGTYNHTFDLTDSGSWNPAFISAKGGTAGSAEAALLAGLNNDDAYLNIHTTVVPGGEIRGFLAVPEPGGLVLLGSSVIGLLFRSRQRH